MYKKSNKEYKTIESLVQAWIDGHKIIHNTTKCEYTIGSFMPAIRVPTQWEVHEKITDWRDWVSEDNPVWCLASSPGINPIVTKVTRFDGNIYWAGGLPLRDARPLTNKDVTAIFQTVTDFTEMFGDQG